MITDVRRRGSRGRRAEKCVPGVGSAGSRGQRASNARGGSAPPRSGHAGCARALLRASARPRAARGSGRRAAAARAYAGSKKDELGRHHVRGSEGVLETSMKRTRTGGLLEAGVRRRQVSCVHASPRRPTRATAAHKRSGSERRLVPVVTPRPSRAGLAAQVREVVTEGDRRRQKALLQAYVQEIKVVSCEEIYPFFFVPAVRPLSGSVQPVGVEVAYRADLLSFTLLCSPVSLCHPWAGRIPVAVRHRPPPDG
jgi:hypothetical protein